MGVGTERAAFETSLCHSCKCVDSVMSAIQNQVKEGCACLTWEGKLEKAGGRAAQEDVDTQQPFETVLSISPTGPDLIP